MVATVDVMTRVAYTIKRSGQHVNARAAIMVVYQSDFVKVGAANWVQLLRHYHPRRWRRHDD